MIEFAYGDLDGICSSLGKCAVVTMEVPWALVKDRLGAVPTSITMVESLDREYLNNLVEELPRVDAVVGIGGGVAIDAAKYLAWKRGHSLVLIPTIVSVDAYVSPEIAVRDNGVVKYTGRVTPAKVVIDYGVIQSAPNYLNTAGAGDVYSSRTALFDWKLSHEKTGEQYDEKIATRSRQALDTLVANAEEIRSVTEKGIRTLVELHTEMAHLMELAGNSRPEEGSEHVFFYALERLTRRSFMHGHVVGTGIYVSTHFQSNQDDEVARIMESMGLMFRPQDCGISRDEFIATILGMRTYAQEVRFPFSILDVTNISRQDAQRLWDKLSA